MINILVTGANGQLGQTFKMMAEYYPYINFFFRDRQQLDITIPSVIEAFFNNFIPDFVINCAAYTNVEEAELDMEKPHLINTLAPGYLAKKCHQYGATLFHISTDYVFDGDKKTPYTEQDETNPISNYGKSKLEGERHCLSESADSFVIRASWLYSPFANNFLKTIIRLGAEKPFLNVINDQRGTPTYTVDLAKAIIQMINKITLNKGIFDGGIYHFSNEGEANWHEFAEMIVASAKIDCPIHPTDTASYKLVARRPTYSVLDKSKIKETFQITIPDWKESVERCITTLSKIPWKNVS